MVRRVDLQHAVAVIHRKGILSDTFRCGEYRRLLRYREGPFVGRLRSFHLFSAYNDMNTVVWDEAELVDLIAQFGR